MPKYRVCKLVDSYVRYVAEIEAESEGDALDKAEEDHKYGPLLRGQLGTPIKWVEDGVSEYDDVQFEIEEPDLWETIQSKVS